MRFELLRVAFVTVLSKRLLGLPTTNTNSQLYCINTLQKAPALKTTIIAMDKLSVNFVVQ